MGSDSNAAAGGADPGTGAAASNAAAPSVTDQLAELLASEPIVSESDDAPKPKRGKAGKAKNGQAAAAVEEPAPSSLDAEAEPDVAASLDEDETPARKEPPWRLGQRQRYKQQLERVSERERAIEERERRMGPVAEVVDAYQRAMAAGDFKGVVRAIVRQMGVSPDEVIAAYASPDDAAPDAKKAKDPELRAVLERLERIERKEKEDQEQYKQLSERREVQRNIDSGVESAMRIPTDPKLRKRWSHVAALKPHILKACMNSLVSDAVMNTPRGQRVALDPLVDQLEHYVRDLKEGLDGAEWLRAQEELAEELDAAVDEDAEEHRRPRTPARLPLRKERDGGRDIGEMSSAEKDRELRRLYREVGKSYNKG